MSFNCDWNIENWILYYQLPDSFYPTLMICPLLGHAYYNPAVTIGFNCCIC